MLNKLTNINAFVLELFLIILAYNLFILKEQRGTIIILATIVYFIFHYLSKGREIKTIFRDVLLFIMAALLLTLLGIDFAAKIMMDYVFVFLFAGMFLEFITQMYSKKKK